MMPDERAEEPRILAWSQHLPVRQTETRASLAGRQVGLLEETNVGPHLYRFGLAIFCPLLLVRRLLRAGLEEEIAMNLEYLISGLITMSLLVYLTYALLKPEKF
jgi:K+-transporting ATPase KdpF subunit